MPSRYDVIKYAKFGKPSVDHSFTSEACIEHVMIFMLKSEFISQDDTKSLLACHPLFGHFNKMLNWSKDVQFTDVKRTYT